MLNTDESFVISDLPVFVLDALEDDDRIRSEESIDLSGTWEVPAYDQSTGGASFFYLSIDESMSTTLGGIQLFFRGDGGLHFALESNSADLFAFDPVE